MEWRGRQTNQPTDPTNATNHFTPFMQTNERERLSARPRSRPETKNPAITAHRCSLPRALFLPLFLAASPIEVTSAAVFCSFPIFLLPPALPRALRLLAYETRTRCSHLFRIAERANARVSCPLLWKCRLHARRGIGNSYR